METTNYGGFWWRCLAMFIDSIILQLASCFAGIGIGMVMGVTSMSTGGNLETVKVMSQLMGSIVGIVIYWIYFALFESSESQATPGKMVCNLKVTDMHGQRLTFARATGRTFGKYLSIFTCLVGYIIAAFTERKQALHDIIANTLVLTKTG